MNAPGGVPNGSSKGMWGSIADFGNKLVGALPPAFITLTLINIMFLAMVMWFFTHQMDQRNALVSKLIDHCMAAAEQLRRD